MAEVTVEIVGFAESECGPFPCDETRSCGLETCYPSNSLMDAISALRDELLAGYGEKVEVKTTLLDEEMPDHIRKIIEERQPPIPIVLVNGRLTSIGRVSLDLIKEEIDYALEES
ncbi:hypothetical protein [Methanoculleus sp.]|jgi:hypothetical protein|uniref:Uncharacterized protein n=1 Tax=Methanoculleus marisnigri TaxID=2198 RepID=A0A101GNA7_9EURY|nr:MULTISPECIES: hypothetical protein [Methanoculleus]KUK61549.1 MAG: hypothetical protein XD82_1050 [Methanoculleus marisnigri]KUK99628.1 MAG: hypothetical protein XE10_1757 [Methanoculleus marisnigri]